MGPSNKTTIKRDCSHLTENWEVPQYDNKLLNVKYEGQEDTFHDLVSSELQCEDDDEDYQLFLNSSKMEGHNLVCMPEGALTIIYGGIESEGKSSKVRKNEQDPFEVTELSNSRQASDDYHRVANKKRHSEMLSDGVDDDCQIYLNSEEKWQNVQVFNEATEPLKAKQVSDVYHVDKHNNEVQCGNDDDDDYQLFLKYVSTDGDNLIYIPENGVTLVYGEECDQSSNDSEPIILDPTQHYKDSPSICSKSYHSSCLTDERNHKDSLYREGLIEELERPYDQKELHKLLQVASQERTKELHREMRNGLIKDRPKRGDDNKTSYLRMHSDLKNAINQVKEPHKVLFLLCGFFYWLKHVPQGGSFRPWLDASCLKMLQKL